MLSRRHFIKKMVGLLALTAGGGWAAGAVQAAESALSAKPVRKRAGAIDGSPKTPLLSLFLLSDLHITVDEASISERLRYALRDISNFESKVEALVLGGDLTDFARDIDYRLLRSILNEYTLPPLYANMGNHDYYEIWLDSRGQFSTDTVPNGKTDAMSRQRFMNFIGYTDKPYHDVWINGVHLIMLSQEVYYEEKPEVGEGAWYSDEQLDWLRERMKEHATGKPSLIFIHQPLPEPGTDGGTHRLIRAKEFRAILEPYKNVFVMSGHSHRTFYGEDHYNWQNSFHWFNNASVGRTRSAGGGLSAQGMYIEVFPHKVVIRGREFVDRTWIQGARWEIPLL